MWCYFVSRPIDTVVPDLQDVTKRTTFYFLKSTLSIVQLKKRMFVLLFVPFSGWGFLA